MVIKERAAKRDRERLHPAADVEREGINDGEENGAEKGRKKRDGRERARRKRQSER